MIYVIKDRRTNEIYIGPDNIARNLAPEEEEEFLLLYQFPWSFSGIQGLLRPWIIHAAGNHTLYTPQVLEVLEEIKSDPEPEKVELRGVYMAAEKIKEFEDGIKTLISYNLLPPINPFPETDIGWIEYEDDLYSSLLSSWPRDYFDLGISYLELSDEERKTLKDIYSTKGQKQEDIFMERGHSIPPELLPVRLRLLRKLGPDTKEIETPGYNDTRKVYPEPSPDLEGLRRRIYKEFPLGSVWERTTVREKLDGIEKLLGLSEKIRATDLRKYFDIRTPNNNKIQIISKKL